MLHSDSFGSASLEPAGRIMLGDSARPRSRPIEVWDGGITYQAQRRKCHPRRNILFFARIKNRDATVASTIR